MRVCLQPTAEEYDITQLHENTYYEVCVKVFATQLSVDDDYDGVDRPPTGTVDVWNSQDRSQPALSDSQLYGEPAVFILRCRR